MREEKSEVKACLAQLARFSWQLLWGCREDYPSPLTQPEVPVPVVGWDWPVAAQESLAAVATDPLFLRAVLYSCIRTMRMYGTQARRGGDARGGARTAVARSAGRAAKVVSRDQQARQRSQRQGEGHGMYSVTTAHNA